MRYFVAVLSFAAAAAVIRPGLADQREVTNYIDSLKYDVRSLLAVKDSGSTESLPGRDASGNSVIICTNTPRKLSKDLAEVTILSPTAGTIFPGAIIRANQSLANGQPAAIGVPRSPVTLHVDLPGLGEKGTIVVDNPSNASVDPKIQEVLEYWNTKPVAAGYVNVARSKYERQKAYSSQQLALDLGFSAKWSDNKVSSSLDVKTNNKTSLTVALFKQVFYTVAMDTPAEPGAVFAKDVSLDQVKRQTDSNSPPAYVASVDYGRIIMVRMETSSAETEANLEGAMDYVTSGGQTLHADLKSKYEGVAKKSTFTVLTLGGNAEVAAETVVDYKTVPQVIQKNAKYSRSNPGYPIAYRTAFLKDNEPAKYAFTTDYVETNCTEYPNGFVKVRHEGGYVARWMVTWMANNLPGVWASGNVTAPYQKTINLPGDAKQVRIYAEAMTGLVWDPWREAISKTETGPTNKCYKIYGTTLSPSWNNNC